MDITSLIDSDYSLAAHNCSSCEEITDNFKQHYRQTGQAVYLWSSDTGLYRVDASHITIPGTQRFSDALEFILSSHHFGIYVLRDSDFFTYSIPNIERMKRLANKENPASVLTLLLGENIQLPDELQDKVYIFDEENTQEIVADPPIPLSPFVNDIPLEVR